MFGRPAVSILRSSLPLTAHRAASRFPKDPRLGLIPFQTRTMADNIQTINTKKSAQRKYASHNKPTVLTTTTHSRRSLRESAPQPLPCILGYTRTMARISESENDAYSQYSPKRSRLALTSSSPVRSPRTLRVTSSKGPSQTKPELLVKA